jgi:hypothetical protein
MILGENSDIYLNSINQLISVMKKFRVLFAVRTDFLNIIRRTSASKGWPRMLSLNTFIS